MNDSMMPPDSDSKGDHLPVPRPPALADLAPAPPVEDREPGGPEGSSGLSVYLHALRRRWLLAAAAGVLCSTLAAGGMWLLNKKQYTSVALFRVAANEEFLVFDTEAASRAGFDIFKNTQQQIIKSDFVLMAALAKPGAAGLPSIQAEDSRPDGDAVKWLAKRLQVQFPGDGELMRISLTCDDPGEAQKLVASVVEAYQAEVVDREKARKRERLAGLEKAYAETESSVRKKHQDLKDLPGRGVLPDSGTQALRAQVAVQQRGEYSKELTRIKFEKMRYEAEIAALEAVLRRKQAAEGRRAAEGDRNAAVDGDRDAGRAVRQTGSVAGPAAPQTPGAASGGDAAAGLGGVPADAEEAGAQLSEMELEAFLANDPIGESLLQEKAQLELKIKEAEEKLAPPIRDRIVGQCRDQLDHNEEALGARREQLRTDLGGLMQLDLRRRIGELRAKVSVCKSQMDSLEADCQKLDTDIKERSETSVDVEILRSELAHLERVLTPIAEEKERLKVELDSEPRITLYQQATRPHSPDESRDLAKSILAAIAAFLGGAGLVIFREARARKINSPLEVSQMLGLSVMGSVPLVPAAVAGRLEARSTRHRRWRAMLNESVRGIVARLIHEAKPAGAHVVMVSSAGGGEGKTTLSVNLAANLARTGHRTLLVDFDLRRPALGRLFGLPAGPGISELVRGEADFDAVVCTTDLDGLWVIPAGRWIADSLGALANGDTEALFDRFRERYDFVIVDGSPVLAVAETGLVSRHADLVILSVLRDVSQRPKVVAACEMLAAFGVRSLAAVMIGSRQDMYYYSYEPDVVD